jgi:hypothetical protein
MSAPRRGTISFNTGKVFARKPPVVVRPNVKADLSEFKSIDDLLLRLEGAAFPPRFAFEKELTLYLLFVSSIWPGDNQRLEQAARIFGGTINFIAGKAQGNGTSSIRPGEQGSFNKNFFYKVGGLESLLFCPSAR